MIYNSCDLLKIRYLCGRNDNKAGVLFPSDVVVICSKFAIFAVEMTTDIFQRNREHKL